MTSIPPPVWLEELAKSVAALMHPVEEPAPIGCHYHSEQQIWEVTIFASLTEVIGGQQDGLRFPSCFVLDVGGLIGLFSDVEAIRWQTIPHGAEDELGAHLAIDGIYREEHVHLRIAAEAPARFEAGRQANVHEMKFVNIW